MTKRTRRFIFFGCLALFFLVVPPLVLFSQGYRFDFNPPPGGKRITQTGGIYLKTDPKGAEVFIDGIGPKKTEPFFGTLLIESLLPKRHRVVIEKDGYQNWQKTLEVEIKEVTEAKNIFLIPEKIDFVKLEQGIKDFWLSPSEKQIVFLQKEPLSKSAWSLKLFDLKKNLKSSLTEEKTITTQGADFLSLEWAPDSKNIYLSIGTKEQEKIFNLNLNKTPPALTVRKLTPTPENIIASTKEGGDTYYLNNSGVLNKNDSPLSGSFPVKEETEYRLKVLGEKIFLLEENSLYFLKEGFEKILDGVNDLKISPDKKKLVIFTNSEIWVLFLDDITSQPQRKIFDKIFLTRFSQKIGEAFWLNDDYLIFNSGDKIKIAGIDDRDTVQIWDIAEFPDPRIIFNQSDEKLYILSRESLFSSKIF